MVIQKYEKKLFELGLNQEQVQQVSILMAQYAMDALHDTEVAKEVIGRCEVGQLLEECKKWRLLRHDLAEIDNINDDN